MDLFAILFDIDGLMLDSERMARVAWTHALADFGYHLTASDYLGMIGRTIDDAQQILDGYFGPNVPFQQIFDRRQVYYEADIETNGLPVKPGLLELLDFLEAHHIPKAVASSTPSWFARRKLEKTGLLPHFSTLVCGDMVPRGKPFPDLFLEAAWRIDVAPRLCVVLEDSDAGIRAACRGGMLPVMIPDLKPPSSELAAIAYCILPSLSDVIPLIEGFIRDGLPDFPLADCAAGSSAA